MLCHPSQHAKAEACLGYADADAGGICNRVNGLGNTVSRPSYRQMFSYLHGKRVVITTIGT